MTTPQEELSPLQVPLDDAAREAWRQRYGITALYLNDIAAGALIEVPADWKADATDKVSDGLRRFLQELWHEDLARPVVAVFWPAEGAAEGEAETALRRLTRDQGVHRGDFALREASDRDEAEALLWALLGDTLGALDDSAREDKVGIAEVDDTLAEEAMVAKQAGNAPWVAPAERLHAALRGELKRARDTRGAPDLVSVLNEWLRSEEVAP